MFFCMAGGAAEWGTLCGSLIAAGIVINLFTRPKDCMKIYNELIGWYTMEPFPSDKLDKIAKLPGQKQSVADSPLCHISVSKWCEASGVRVSSKEHVDRCAKVTGDVAAKTVELLNLHAEKKLKSQFELSPETLRCMGCHGRSREVGNTLTKMKCVECHAPHD